jgi:hypothetical protein
MKSPASQCLLGPLGPKGTARHYVAPRIVFDDPQRVTNAMQKDPLDLSHEWRNSAARPGAEDHRQHRSLMTGPRT